MNKIKMTKEEFNKRTPEMMMRSCWNCNSAHKHLKKADYIIWCFECGKLYLKGKEIEIVGEDKPEYLVYSDKECINCGRLRVEKYSDGTEICEKCNFDQNKKEYVLRGEDNDNKTT